MQSWYCLLSVVCSEEIKEFAQEISLEKYSDCGSAFSDPYLTFSVSENMLGKKKKACWKNWYIQHGDAFPA